MGYGGTKNKSASPSRVYRLVMLGTGGVGKSAITVRYVHKLFNNTYDPTIEDSYSNEVVVDDVTYQVEILDTAGSDQFEAMKDSYMKNGDGFVLVFSLDSKSSMDQLTEIRDEILRIKDLTSIPMMLVGNKCDLPNREVNIEQGQALGVQFKCPYIEVSAKNDQNVREVFQELVRSILILDKTEEQHTGDSCHCVLL